jgi:hypothetical protein
MPALKSVRGIRRFWYGRSEWFPRLVSEYQEGAETDSALRFTKDSSVYTRLAKAATHAPNGQRASRQGVRQGKVPGARASPMVMAHAPAKRPEMRICPGETSGNGWLPGRNAKRCVIARTKGLRTGKGPRARAFAWAKCLAPGSRPWARRTPWPNAPKWDFAQAKRLEMGGCPGEMPREARLRSRTGTERAKGLAPGRSPGRPPW